MPTFQAPGILDRPGHDIGEAGTGQGHWIVTVFNNDKNTYDEVIRVLMAATGCSELEASEEAWEIDHLGKSVVHHGKEQVCRRAAEVISTIGIQVEVGEE